MQLNYHHHFTEDDVTQILLDAQRIVREAALDPELFRTGFEKAIDLLSQKVAVEVAGAIAMPRSILGAR